MKESRCPWARNELAIRYHDEEWGVPVHDDVRWFEFLTLEGAQAGLSWDTILRKRENYRNAFAGFDPARDIEAITVNRWAHGYAYEYNRADALFDPDWKEGEHPWVVGRKTFGRIAIANSDAGASAETDAAIDQAYRAIGELQAARG